MAVCSAYGCKENAAIRHPGITFHKFPRNPVLRQRWIAAVRRKDFIPSKSAVLCSKHFREEDMDRSSQSIVRLKEGAVPSIFDGFPAHLKEKLRLRAAANMQLASGDKIAPSPSTSQLVQQHYEQCPQTVTTDANQPMDVVTITDGNSNPTVHPQHEPADASVVSNESSNPLIQLLLEPERSFQLVNSANNDQEVVTSDSGITLSSLTCSLIDHQYSASYPHLRAVLSTHANESSDTSPVVLRHQSKPYQRLRTALSTHAKWSLDTSNITEANSNPSFIQPHRLTIFTDASQPMGTTSVPETSEAVRNVSSNGVTRNDLESEQKRRLQELERKQREMELERKRRAVEFELKRREVEFEQKRREAEFEQRQREAEFELKRRKIEMEQTQTELELRWKGRELDLERQLLEALNKLFESRKRIKMLLQTKRRLTKRTTELKTKVAVLRHELNYPTAPKFISFNLDV